MDFNLRELDTVYEAVSSNRNENNISTRGQYLLYSRCRCPIIYDTELKEIKSTLSGHEGEVANQSWVHYKSDTKNPPRKLHIISTAHDKSAIIWEVETGETNSYKALYRFSSPDDNVFLTASCTLGSDHNYYSVTTTIDGHIYCWRNDELLKTIENQFCCLTSVIFTLSIDEETNLSLLFLSSSDKKVHVFQFLESYQPNDSDVLEHLFDLTGYNDWVKSIDNLKLFGRQNEFLTATASQDSLIRVWHMNFIIDKIVDPTKIRTIISKPLKSTKANSTIRLCATLETVLSGHDGFVHGLCWFKKPQDSSLQLLSCSADKTMVLWRSTISPIPPQNSSTKYEQYPASQSVWSEALRLGETGETNLPFIGICLSDIDEMKFYALSLRGAIHSWEMRADETLTWVASDSISGHHESVTDLSWEKSGSYLLSCSLDKTTRLHGLAKTDNRWHELTRPQVHGHEINCVASLNSMKFASGAEEKTIRTFGATQFFLRNYKQLAAIEEGHSYQDLGISINSEDQEQLPAHAQLPALGLSNRGASSPYDIGTDAKENKIAAGNALPASQDGAWNEISNLVKRLAEIDHLTELPYEEILLQSTLWWEMNKLFGHCNELHALASDSCGKMLASASKANRADLAKIIVWECEKFRKVATIEHHSLTITRLKFSPNDQYLLSVSRDRTWSLSERTGSIRNAYKFICGTTKSNAIHERIIWDCCWTYDSEYFITVSRDKRVIMWSVKNLLRSDNQGLIDHASSDTNSCENSAPDTCVASSKLFDCPVQAVDSLPATKWSQEADTVVCDDRDVSKCLAYIIALGFEGGRLELSSISRVSDKDQWRWTRLRVFPNHHQLSIRRLAFRPSSRSGGYRDKDYHWLASGGDDSVVKLIKFKL